MDNTVLMKNAAPLRIRITARDNLKKDSDLLIDQIRPIDNKRLVQGPFALLNRDFLTTVYNAVCEVRGLH